MASFYDEPGRTFSQVIYGFYIEKIHTLEQSQTIHVSFFLQI